MNNFFENPNKFTLFEMNSNNNDIISDLIIRIKNAHLAKHRLVAIPRTKMSIEITKILKEEGYIREYQTCVDFKKNTKYLLLILKYKSDNVSIITGIKRVSKPGSRVYLKTLVLPTVRNNLGTVIISTSQGIMTNKKARKLGIGGEILCYIW